MSLIIGSARSSSLPDEAEVSEQDFYIHKKGWLVIHHPKKSIRHTIAMCMRNACANPNLFYSQPRRAEIYLRGTDAKQKTYCDCSSLLTQIVREALTNNFPNCTTDTFPKTASKYGFIVTKYKDGDKLYNGDILCTQTKGHIVAVTHGGIKNV